MVRIAVCDDEKHVLDRTLSLLQEYKRVPIEVDRYESGEALLESAKRYAVILLDIDMQGMNGIETAEQIRKKDRAVKLIYVTNYSDYTIFAFAVHAFAYLLKPLEKEALFAQLDEALDYGIQTPDPVVEFVTKEGVLRVKTTEIVSFEYQNREVLVHTTGKLWHMKKRINEVAEEMRQYDFVMPHKSFVVNLYCVQNIHGYDIHMTDGTVIPLSQKKSVEFRRALNQYLAGRRGGIQ